MIAHSLLSPSEFPYLLSQIADPPKELYILGSPVVPLFPERPWVAVVGSRLATGYGYEAVKRLVEPLAAAGAVIVSGLAYGIDRAAHEAALAVGGATVAVLGTPIDKIYPAEHAALAHQIIASGGLILSELPPGAKIHRGLFPKRNRIIAGLCQAVLVVEADIKSGSLITARLALEENREVLAVPGPITSTMSRGTNELIKQGARPITGPEDLLECLGLSESAAVIQTALPVDLTEVQERLLGFLSATTPSHIDALATRSELTVLALQSELTLLELSGQVKMTAPGLYIRL